MTRTEAQRRQALREPVNGRMVATHLPPERHGTTNGYDKWFCRCEPCSDAHRARGRAIRARTGSITLEEREQQRADEFAYLTSEYEFMRSFGMNHERACKYIGQNPVTFRRRLERASHHALAA